MKKKDPTQEAPPKAEEHETREEKSTVSRRKFLKASALGAGALALPIVAHGSTDPLQPEVGEDNEGTPPAASKQAVDWKTQKDTWVEPWEFVQKDWPGQSLHLDVVEHAAPVALLGNIVKAEDVNVGTLLFSWNGISPAPTMRVGGDETLHVNVRNMLGPNDGVLLIPNGIVPAKGVSFTKKTGGTYDFVVPTSDYCRPIHSNHKHQLHTTNIHFHGSHVAPYLNTDGTRSDDVFARIIPQGDFQLRQRSENPDPDHPALQDPACWPLHGSEVMGQQQYQYRLGKPGGARETHPPGTHWYHPHAHGSTFTQVASGMAGVVIVEGDVDEYLKEQLDNGNGSFYERVMVLQRIVGPTSVDFEEDLNDLQKTKSTAAFPAVNGQSTETVDNYIVLAPEAVERWRVLNAGVDGQAYIDLMVLDLKNPDDLVNKLLTKSDGTLSGAQQIIWKTYGSNRDQVNPDILTINIASGGKPITWTKTTAAGTTTTSSATGDADILEVLYSQMAEYLYSGTMNHLASDGITLVNGEGKYHTRPVTQPMMLSPANRMDFLFQAPSLTSATADPKLLTIWIRETLTGTDAVLASAGAGGTKILQKIATIITRGTATPPPSINPKTGDPLDLNDLVFPPVPHYLKPVTVQDITVKPTDPDYDHRTVNTGARVPNNNGMMRGRRVIYSGWGGGSFPQGTSNRKNEVAAFYRIPQKVTSGGVLGGVSGPETMMIDCRKFNDDPENLEDIGHHMLLETAEEWTVSNFTMTLFGNDQTGALPPTPTKPDPRTHLGNKPYPSSQQKTNITTKAVDHPFHIHINPCWVVGIYDWEGKRLNWNYERYDGVAGKESFYPRWHDVIRLPRNGGWVVFRSRFWDFDGQYVNHCHILQHEDNGMMQGIAVVPDASQADYVPFDRGTNYRPSGTNPVFRKPTWEECYEMDWGLGDTKTVTGEEQRTQCIALRTRLRTPQP